MTDPVRPAVEDAIGSALRSWSGPRPREWSWHFAATTEAGIALIVKVPRWEEAPRLEDALAAGPQDDTRAEFAALEAIHAAVEASGDPGLVAVRPVAYLPEVNAIVMERLASRSLGERLGFRRGDGADLFAAVGRWLDLYHGLAPVHTGAPNPRDGSAAGFAGPMVDLAGRLVAARRSLGERRVLGITHGDLTLGNILVTDDGRVAVIDPNRLAGPLASDGARLLAEARVGRRQLRTLGRWSPPGVVDDWADALIRSQPRLDPAEARVAEAEAVFARWLEFRVGRGRVARMIGDRVFAGELSRLLDRL